jgi:hypothetical protein
MEAIAAVGRVFDKAAVGAFRVEGEPVVNLSSRW